eukprot:TRINITY_DN127_c0_g2_i5.p4 TRINITY_DN127_c0_g2~~TRINITY_DN127_c0_g2_i5.p4  ORF type:complete len:124 (+),score=15.76 TRINITY_DN127_c0_g2_i5:894-1265(+)
MRFHDEMARIRAMLDEMARIRAMLNLAATAHAQVKWAVWDTPIPPDLLPSVASLNAAVDFMELAVFRAVLSRTTSTACSQGSPFPRNTGRSWRQVWHRIARRCRWCRAPGKGIKKRGPKDQKD